MADWFNTPMIIIVVLAVFGAGWKIVYWVASVDKDRILLKDDAEKDRSLIQSFMKEIRDDIKRIFMNLPPLSTAGGSPVQLTEFGTEISDHLKAKNWAQKLAPSLSSRVKGKAEFEIYEFCGSYVKEDLPEEWERKISEAAYKFATDKKGILAVLSVELRDALLSLAH